ncbi:amidohydrolase family protein [Holtiella tumoricola]
MMNFILRGSVCYSKSPTELVTLEKGYVVCKDNVCEGVYTEIPEAYKAYPVKDCGERIIIPGMADLHTHAPQYTFRGLGMDKELLDWLNAYTFPEEAKYEDEGYARQAYQKFASDLKQTTTTRACIFGTIHPHSTEILMEQLEATGLITYVGKVNMDQNAPDYLCESSAAESVIATEKWINTVQSKFKNTKPMITPRFVPSCSGELLEKLHDVQEKYQLPVQSHLSENMGEIQLVQELFPQSSCYADVYHQYGLIDKECKTVMAHCVYCSEEEMKLLKENQVYVAHCPESNANLASGIAPIRKYMEHHIPIGLGSDVAAGSKLSIFYAMQDAIVMSKMRWRLVDNSLAPLTFEEAFYLATKGGGSFFGKVGSFEPGYEFDAVILDDKNLETLLQLSIKERAERMMYLADDRNIVGKYVAGKEV